MVSRYYIRNRFRVSTNELFLPVAPVAPVAPGGPGSFELSSDLPGTPG